jgi:thiamine kinase-like enzyme
LEVLEDNELKSAAGLIDIKLKTAKYQTFVHGDAKLANFCFSPKGDKVAAVDYQYVGGGCGMKDVAYFIGSCLHEDECEKMEKQLLDTYFSELKIAIQTRNKVIDFDELEVEWRDLFPLAWTDFHRFLKGWSPGHWKINSYSEQMARKLIATLNLEK